jgi:hypothetical protein
MVIHPTLEGDSSDLPKGCCLSDPHPQPTADPSPQAASLHAPLPGQTIHRAHALTRRNRSPRGRGVGERPMRRHWRHRLAPRNPVARSEGLTPLPPCGGGAGGPIPPFALSPSTSLRTGLSKRPPIPPFARSARLHLRSRAAPAYTSVRAELVEAPARASTSSARTDPSSAQADPSSA